LTYAKDVNDVTVGMQFYYLFSFCNVSYYTEYSCQSKVVIYYKEVPLFYSIIESVDEGRTSVISPELSVVDPHYIEDSFRYLMFEFVFKHWCGNYLAEAREMFLRVIPVYRNDEEHEKFRYYVQSKGFMTCKLIGEKIEGEALERLKNVSVGKYDSYDILGVAESVAQELKENKDLVINFASLENTEYNQITESLQKWKMVMDWHEEWRNFKRDN